MIVPIQACFQTGSIIEIKLLIKHSIGMFRNVLHTFRREDGRIGWENCSSSRTTLEAGFGELGARTEKRIFAILEMRKMWQNISLSVSKT